MPETDTTPVSASIATTGQSFRYIGNYVYGFSGTFEASNASADMFSFTTGSGIIVGEFTFNGQVRYVSGSAGGHSVFELQLNDLTVGVYKTETAASDMPSQLFQRVVIPPQTKVLVKCISGEDTSTELLTCLFHGRVYGAE